MARVALTVWDGAQSVRCASMEHGAQGASLPMRVQCATWYGVRMRLCARGGGRYAGGVTRARGQGRLCPLAHVQYAAWCAACGDAKDRTHRAIWRIVCRVLPGGGDHERAVRYLRVSASRVGRSERSVSESERVGVQGPTQGGRSVLSSMARVGERRPPELSTCARDRGLFYMTRGVCVRLRVH